MIRQAVVDDVSALLEVQQANGYNTWTQRHVLETVEKGYCWLLEHHKKVIGFAFFSCIADEAELLNIVLLKSYQGKGMATALLVRALSQLAQQEVSCCFLEVAENNHQAFQLYEKLGFKVKGKRKKYYQTAQGAEDALLMKLLLNG